MGSARFRCDVGRLDGTEERCMQRYFFSVSETDPLTVAVSGYKCNKTVPGHLQQAEISGWKHKAYKKAAAPHPMRWT